MVTNEIGFLFSNLFRNFVYDAKLYYLGGGLLTGKVKVYYLSEPL